MNKFEKKYKGFYIEDASTFLKTSKHSIKKLVEESKIPYHVINQRLNFLRKELIGWIKFGMDKTIKELEKEVHTYIKQQS